MVELQGQSPVSLNPTNWKHIDFSPEPDATVGCDLPGTVEVASSAVKKQFKKEIVSSGPYTAAARSNWKTARLTSIWLLRVTCRWRFPRSSDLDRHRHWVPES